MFKFNVLLALAILLSSCLVVAEPVARGSHWYVSVGLGYATPLTADSMLVPTSSETPPDTLIPESEERKLLYGLGAGYSWQWNRHWFSGLSFGMLTQYASSSPHGVVNEYSFPEADNYQYNYKTSSLAFLTDIEINVLTFSKLSLFVSGGIGASRNCANNYEETPLVSPARISLGYANKCKFDFAYDLGTGLRVDLNKRLAFKVNYEYFDFGKGELGFSSIRPGLKGPNVSVRGQAFLAGLIVKI